MKYVSVDVKIGATTRREVVAFPNDFVHAIMADAIVAACKRQWPKAKITVHGAGEIDVVAQETYSRSESLDLDSDSQDARMFNSSDYSGHLL